VARGWLLDDTSYAQGLDNGAWITGFPASVEVSRDLLRRGKQRFEIYCTPCHGYDGRGAGMVAARSQKIGQGILPRNLVDPGAGVITQPNGQLFNTISNGNNTMMGYGAQIPIADRWAIVAYVRALERSQFAAGKDLTDSEKSAAMGATP
jgi:mono/diheme cytochrome c family protein